MAPIKAAILLQIAAIITLTEATPISNDPETPDLSYLGSRVFGSPTTNTNIQNWNEEYSQNPEELGEYAEGDILFPGTSRNGLVAQSTRWPNGEVPYEIKGGYSSKDLEVIQRAIGIYHKYTCIK